MRQKTEQNRTAIIAASKTEFLRRGSYTSTSMADIAARAGVAKQTVYSYFSNKEDLFLATMEHTVDHPWDAYFGPLLQSELSTPRAFRDALRTVLKKCIETMMRPDYIGLMRIIFAESKTQPQLALLFRSRIPERGLEAVTELLRRSPERKDADSPELGARMLLGALITYVVFYGLLDNQLSRQPSVAELDEMVAQVCR